MRKTVTLKNFDRNVLRVLHESASKGEFLAARGVAVALGTTLNKVWRSLVSMEMAGIVRKVAIGEKSIYIPSGLMEAVEETALEWLGKEWTDA